MKNRLLRDSYGASHLAAKGSSARKRTRNDGTIAVLFLFLLMFVSCKKKPSNISGEISLDDLSPSFFTWYAFSNDSYEKVSKISAVPSAVSKPWTEAVRISSISCAAYSSEYSKVPQAYSIVNRLGVLVFEEDKIEFAKDYEIFNGRTAGNIVFYNDSPVFSVYRSSFFNDLEMKTKTSYNPFLVMFSPEQKLSYPIVDTKSLGLTEKHEITDFIWDGNIWTCVAKLADESKTDFSYFSFQPKIELSSISPENCAESIYVSKTSEAEYRNAQKFLDYEDAPYRLKNLLSTLPQDAPFTVFCATAGGHSPRTYISQSEKFSENSSLFAHAIISQVWCAALFEDGTMFFKGSLYGKAVVNGGNVVALKLPKLTSGFVYSGFAITGSTLYVSWEEKQFFKTAKSGFLKVELEKIVY